MNQAATWVTRLKSRFYNATRSPIFPPARRCFMTGCAALLAGMLLMMGSAIRAATIEGDDILVVDSGANKLYRVDGRTGVRSVISNFSDSTQGQVNFGGLLSVAVAPRQVFVSDGAWGIFQVDPCNGQRTVTGGLKLGGPAILTPGLATDGSGTIFVSISASLEGYSESYLYSLSVGGTGHTVLASFRNGFIGDLAFERPWGDPGYPHGALLMPASGGESTPYGLYRVDPVTGQQSLLSDFVNPAQGEGNVGAVVGLTVAPSGTIIANAGARLLNIDAKSGNRTVLTNFSDPAGGPTGAQLLGAAFQRSGYVVVAADANLLRVNVRTGKRVVFSDSANPRQGPAFSHISGIAAVPRNAGFYAAPAGSFSSPFGPAR